MHKAALFAPVLALLSAIFCAREPYGVVSHRNRAGRADQWVYKSEDGYKILIDTQRRTPRCRQNLQEGCARGCRVRSEL